MKRSLIILLLTACGPNVESGSEGSGSEGGDSTSSTSASTTTDDAGPPPEGCTCTDPGFCGDVTPECGGEELCPTLVTDCARPVSWYGCAGQEFLYDEETLACALDALANRTPGWFDIHITSDDPGTCGLEGCSSDDWRVRITGETAVRSYCYQEPLSDGDASDRLVTLETPSYFQACKDQPSGQAQLDCLFDGLTSPEPIACR